MKILFLMVESLIYKLQNFRIWLLSKQPSLDYSTFNWNNIRLEERKKLKAEADKYKKNALKHIMKLGKFKTREEWENACANTLDMDTESFYDWANQGGAKIQ